MHSQINRKNLIIVTVLFSIALLIRLFLVSKYLDEWDSVQYALSLHEFNLEIHQPHPPGYPSYVFLATVINWILQNDTLTLNMLSVFSGALSVVFTYLLGKEMYNEKVGIISAIIISLTPAHLVFSIIAMTDIVFLMFLTASVYCLYIGLRSNKLLYIGAFLATYAVGIRPQNFILVAILLIAFLYWKKEIVPIIKSIIFAAIGGLIWFVPASLLSGGVINYLRLARTQIDAIERFVYTVKTIENYFTILLDGWTISILIFAAIVIMAGVIAIRKNVITIKHIEKNSTLLILWIVIASLVYISIYQLYISRYLLPIFAPLSIIFGASIVWLTDNIRYSNIKKIIYVCASIAVIIMAYQALSHAYLLSNITPAPIQACDYIKYNYSPHDTMLVATDSYRHFQYYLPNFNAHYNLPKYANILNKNTSTIVSDIPLSIADPVVVQKYHRSYDIYQKHDNVSLYQTNLYLEPFASTGFYYPEYDGNFFRWMTNDSEIWIYSPTECQGVFCFEIRSINKPRHLFVELNNATVYESIVSPEYSVITIPVNLVPGDNTIKMFSNEDNIRPCDVEGTVSNDDRQLAFAIRGTSFIEANKTLYIDIGKYKYSPCLRTGFSSPEKWSDELDIVWSSGNQSELFIVSTQFLDNSSQTITLTMKCLPFLYDSSNRMIEIYVNNNYVGQISITEGWNQYTVEISREYIVENGYNTITFKYGDTTSPREAGVSDDPRPIAIAWDWVELK
ncbi:ArnT family glycosyltransferase [Methanocella arvoryzae]|uniref:Glycosyltransferase RgtA/B/C/D-like domain-containing protein n=1 Tax=Methanocella arvoryzae (strain DSM 22066 / NBRC 105507 / MRE50) TaxID=351160 RepID=Q0W7F2_METAR|nr:glycosyltransferase family 39 protein [Methanocella arvoryzae]CAJ35691.1 hypothetical protein RCIX211 [Methanocella arvoryzae MRE50]